MKSEGYIRTHMQKALNLTDSADEARTYLAILIANSAASGSTGYVSPSLIEAYRRVSAMAEAELKS